MTAPSETSTDPRPEFAPALQTIVELVRRIMHADVASILELFIDRRKRFAGRPRPALPFRTIIRSRYFVPREARLPAARSKQARSGSFRASGVDLRLPRKEVPVHLAEGICDMAVAPCG
jgi:hypothetical protein